MAWRVDLQRRAPAMGGKKLRRATVKVSEILRLKGSAIVTVKPTDSLATLSQLLREKRIGAVVVSKDGRSIDGVISERDVTYALATHGANLHKLAVSELMTKTVITCLATDSIATVASKMMSRGIRHIPVEDAGTVAGMVSIRDVLSYRLGDLQQEAAGLRLFAREIDRVPQDRE
jgi:CBS domain-containing protein